MDGMGVFGENRAKAMGQQGIGQVYEKHWIELYESRKKATK